MTKPVSTLSPQKGAFAEVWHAQTLAIADTMIQLGCISATGWAETLGEELRAAEREGAPDTEQTYYMAALRTLSLLLDQKALVSENDLEERVAAWESAYRNTAHGEQVLLSASTK